MRLFPRSYNDGMKGHIVTGLGLVGDLDVMSFVSPHIFLDFSV